MNFRFALSIFIGVALLLASCSTKTEEIAPAPTLETALPSPTPYLCSPENLPKEAVKVNDLMREFDDYARLASSVTQTQLIQIIPSMQEVRRRAESLEAPACLNPLKSLQINHMNAVIETLIAFMSNANVDFVNAGIAQARDFHQQYDLELARLLGIAVITITPPPADGAQATIPAPESTAASGILITNNSAAAINVYTLPDTSSARHIMEANQTAAALGKTADGQWLQIEVPGKPGVLAWAQISTVMVTGDLNSLPIISP